MLKGQHLQQRGDLILYHLACINLTDLHRKAN